MKKIALFLILALALSLASCTAVVVEEEDIEDVKENVENVETPEEPEMPELPWTDGPVETPIIPPQFIEESEAPADETDSAESTDPTQSIVPVEPTAPEEAPQLDEKELPILQIVPEENETPAIPIN